MHPWVPQEAVGVMLTIFLSFLIGLEREEQRARTQAYHFGGIRTYPLLGLSGFILSRLYPQSPLAVIAGLVVITPFLAISYYYKLTREQGGMTSEIAGIIAYLAGALVGNEMYWIAATVVIINVFLLQAKEGLEKLGKVIPASEINTFLQFLIITAVLLPIVPDSELTRFHINPFKTWLVVVAVCGISYASYILQRLFRSHESILLSALLGGAYSSTLTTVVMAKKAKAEPSNPVYPYAILAASSLMYARVALLVLLFSKELFARVGGVFIGLAIVGVTVSYVCVRWQGRTADNTKRVDILENRNPLELMTAFVFAGIFILMVVAIRLVAENFGRMGTYMLGVLMGFVDVDAFIVSVMQSMTNPKALNLAVAAVVVVASSNNVAKGIYAMVFGDRRTGLLSLLFLVLLSIPGLLVLVIR